MPSGFTRGVKVSAKSTRRHARKGGGASRRAETIIPRKEYDDILTS